MAQTQLIRKYRTMRSDIYARLRARAFYRRPQRERDQADMAAILADVKAYNERVTERPHKRGGNQRDHSAEHQDAPKGEAVIKNADN